MSESTEITPPAPRDDGRDAKGHFVKGQWKGGPGNPLARQAVELRRRVMQAASKVCTPGEMEKVIETLLESAKAGDVPAAKVLLEIVNPPLSATIREKIELQSLNEGKTALKEDIDHDAFKRLYLERIQRVSIGSNPAADDRD